MAKGRIAVFVDAGYFWVQACQVVLGGYTSRTDVTINYPSLRAEMLAEVKSQFPEDDLLRIYWYDAPGRHGKADTHLEIDRLDDFKLRLGTLTGEGRQKAVDGLIIADMINLAQSKAITSAILVSGDADLMPGVIAAQGLGLRVHLLSMGPDVATSPFLKAEADQKAPWTDATVRKFVTARSTPATVVASPAQAGQAQALAAASGGKNQVAAAAAGAQAPIVSVQAAVVAAAPAPAIPAVINAAADECFVLLEQAEKASIPRAGGSIPIDIDRRLMKITRVRIGRLLTELEKRQARAALRALV